MCTKSIQKVKSKKWFWLFKIFRHPILGSEGKKMFKQYLKSEQTHGQAHTHRHTHGQIDL